MIGISALRRSVDWWPVWGGAAVAVVLLLLPVRGRAGLGIAILAGLAAIPNLWNHYLPFVLMALALIGADLADRWRNAMLNTRLAGAGIGPDRRSPPRSG